MPSTLNTNPELAAALVAYEALDNQLAPLQAQQAALKATIKALMEAGDHAQTATGFRVTCNSRPKWDIPAKNALILKKEDMLAFVAISKKTMDTLLKAKKLTRTLYDRLLKGATVDDTVSTLEFKRL